MSGDLPTVGDLSELRAKVEAAIAAIPEVREVGGYPIYPSSFGDLTDYISRSPWHRTDYVEDMKKPLRDRIGKLDLGELRSYLTFLCRVDRFSPGGLLGELKSGNATALVERADAMIGQGGSAPLDAPLYT